MKFKVGDKVWFNSNDGHKGYNPIIYQISDIDGNHIGGIGEEYLSQPQPKDTKQELDPYTLKVIGQQRSRYLKTVTDVNTPYETVVHNFGSYMYDINENLQVLPDDK